MTIVNMLQAKTQLSRLVDAVESGAEAEVIIARNGRPAARLVPLKPKGGGVRLGLAKGKFEIPDDIDQDNELIERMFAGEPTEGE